MNRIESITKPLIWFAALLLAALAAGCGDGDPILGGTVVKAEYETDIYDIEMRKYFEEEKKKAETLSSILTSLFSNKIYPTGVNNLGLLSQGMMIPPKR